MSTIHYKAKYRDLIKIAEKRGLRVAEVTKHVLGDFAGQNYLAGKPMGFDIPDNTIYILDDMTYKDRFETLRHELEEIGLMKAGHSYWEAHRSALRTEGKGG